jgi:hypothetical protein
MKIYHIVILAVLSALSIKVLSQSEEKKFSFRLLYGGGLAERRLTVNEEFDYPEGYNAQGAIDGLLSLEKGGYSGQYSLLMSFQWKPRLSIQAGFQYHTFNRSLEFSSFSNIIDPRRPSYDPSIEMINKVTVIDEDRFVGLPIALQFDMIQKEKLKLWLSAGAALHYYTDTKQQIIYDYTSGENKNTSRFKQDNYSDVNIAPFLGLGADFKLTSRITLITVLQANAHLLSELLPDHPQRQSQQSALLLVGLCLK